MSIKVMTRVWEYAEYKDSTLLVLLALADYADDNGICWPSQPEIAKKARLSDRQVRNVLNQLVADGEVLMEPSKGRGHPARYCVLSGLSDSDRDKRRKIFPGKNFQENKTRKFATENPEICDTKGGNLSHIKYIGDEAAGSAESRQPKNDNRHDPSIDPSSTVRDGEFLRTLIRDYGIGSKRAKEIVATGADPETVYQSIRNRLDPKDPHSLGRIILDLVDAPPETGKPYAGPYGKPSAPNGTGPKMYQPKKDALSREALAALARGEKP